VPPRSPLPPGGSPGSFTGPGDPPVHVSRLRGLVVEFDSRFCHNLFNPSFNAGDLRISSGVVGLYIVETFQEFI
jgi:hypothetical protein